MSQRGQSSFSDVLNPETHGFESKEVKTAYPQKIGRLKFTVKIVEIHPNLQIFRFSALSGLAFARVAPILLHAPGTGSIANEHIVKKKNLVVNPMP